MAYLSKEDFFRNERLKSEESDRVHNLALYAYIRELEGQAYWWKTEYERLAEQNWKLTLENGRIARESLGADCE